LSRPLERRGGRRGLGGRRRSAGGTLYSYEREILDAERDYWQPRVAVHFGAKLLQWAMFDFGQEYRACSSS
jgi:hypothetical protein